MNQPDGKFRQRRGSDADIEKNLAESDRSCRRLGVEGCGPVVMGLALCAWGIKLALESGDLAYVIFLESTGLAGIISGIGVLKNPWG